jgi:hypothetical protein
MHIVEYCETGSSAQDDNKVTMVHVIIVVYNIAFYCRTTMKQANPRARLLKAFKVQTIELKRTTNTKPENIEGSLQTIYIYLHVRFPTALL